MTPLEDTISEQFAELLAKRFSTRGGTFWVDEAAAAYAWLTAATNLIGIVTARRGVHWEQATAAMADDNLGNGVPMPCVTRMHGVLAATDADRRRGLLGNIEYTIYAETFDDFLDHAATFHKAGKVQESAILASAVLEDSIKKIAAKNGIASDESLEPVIDKLIGAGIFSTVYGKRVKGYVAVRNSAFHARWDELTIQDVGAAINGIRELVETKLD